MKIDINKVKIVPKSISKDFQFCVFGTPEKDVQDWIDANGFSTIKSENFVNIIIPAETNLSDIFLEPKQFEWMDGFSPNLNKFIGAIQKLASTEIAAMALVPKLKIEAELDFSAITLPLADTINKLAPYGQNNPQPRFVSYDLRIDDIVTMGFDNQHIKIRFSQFSPQAKTAHAFWALAFGSAANYRDYKVGDRVDLVYYLEVNDFNGRREAQLKIIDLKKYE
jgi:hypothetical protein